MAKSVRAQWGKGEVCVWGGRVCVYVYVYVYVYVCVSVCDGFSSVHLISDNITSIHHHNNIYVYIYIYMCHSHPLHTPQCMVGVTRNPRVVSIMMVIPTPVYVKAYVTVTVNSLINSQITW